MFALFVRINVRIMYRIFHRMWVSYDINDGLKHDISGENHQYDVLGRWWVSKPMATFCRQGAVAGIPRGASCHGQKAQYGHCHGRGVNGKPARVWFSDNDVDKR